MTLLTYEEECDPGLAPMLSSYWHELSPQEPTFNSGEVNLSSIGGGGEIATLRRWIDRIGQFGMRSLRPTVTDPRGSNPGTAISPPRTAPRRVNLTSVLIRGIFTTY